MYRLDEELNEDEETNGVAGWCAYKKSEGNELVVVFRGSQSSQDWLVHDVSIVLSGSAHTAMPKALAFFDRAVEKHKPDRICVTGHSLGGTIAYCVAHRVQHERKVTGHIFNPGASHALHPSVALWDASSSSRMNPLGIVGNMTGWRWMLEGITAHHIIGDPISMNWESTEIIRYNPGTLINFHAISNFIDDERA